MLTYFVELLAIASAGDFVYSQYVARAIPKVCITRAGCVIGKTMPGYRIESFEAFLGIPYAKPPVGELRFSHPQPYPKWNGILRATQPQRPCIQKDALLRNASVNGVEDCLYLNVYRPMPKSRPSKKLPVMVYIHGGGFFAGTANPDVVGPEYIMDTEEVILVTIAYRLGVFGFLSTKDSVIPGNFGLKDQTLGLKWVKNNIFHFGGNPNEVTLFGQSAGGISSHMHMLSKHSKGLFKRIISLSGTANIPLAIQQDPLEAARKLAEYCQISNVNSLSSIQLLRSLRSIDAHTLMRAVDAIKYWDTHPVSIFCPVVENFNSPNAFLCEHPKDILVRGNYKAVPFMAGIVPEEGAFRAINLWEFNDLRDSFNADFDRLLELFLQFPLNFTRPRLNAAMAKIIDRYFDGNHELSKKGIMEVTSDRVFKHPFYNDVKTFVNTNNKSAMQVYIFNYTGPYSYTSYYTGGLPNLDYGVVHADELIYLFRSPGLFPDFHKNSTHAMASKELVRHFVDFATNRNSPQNPLCTKETFPQNSLDKICNYVLLENGPSNALVKRIDNKFNIRPLRMWDEILEN